MKKKFCLVFSLLLITSFVFSQESKYRIDGKSYSKQIYDENDNQITQFENWEYIKDFYISPDNKKNACISQARQSKGIPYEPL